MSGRRASQAKRRRKRAQELRPQEAEPRQKWLRHTVEWGLGISTVAGLVLAALTFLPRMSVDPGGSFDPLHPYPLSFTIANTGMLPLSKVQPLLGICELDLGPNSQGGAIRVKGECESGPAKTLFDPGNLYVGRLGIDQKHMILLAETVPFHRLDSAVLSVTVRYEPWFVPISRSAEFRFITRPDGTGKLMWVPQSHER